MEPPPPPWQELSFKKVALAPDAEICRLTEAYSPASPGLRMASEEDARRAIKKYGKFRFCTRLDAAGRLPAVLDFEKTSPRLTVRNTKEDEEGEERPKLDFTIVPTDDWRGTSNFHVRDRLCIWFFVRKAKSRVLPALLCRRACYDTKTQVIFHEIYWQTKPPGKRSKPKTPGTRSKRSKKATLVQLSQRLSH